MFASQQWQGKTVADLVQAGDALPPSPMQLPTRVTALGVKRGCGGVEGGVADVQLGFFHVWFELLKAAAVGVTVHLFPVPHVPVRFLNPPYVQSGKLSLISMFNICLLNSYVHQCQSLSGSSSQSRILVLSGKYFIL